MKIIWIFAPKINKKSHFATFQMKIIWIFAPKIIKKSYFATFKWKLFEFLRQKSTKKSHFATFQMKIIRIFAPKINKKVSSLCFFPSSVKDYHISANLIGFILIAQLQVSNSQLVKNHQSYDYFGTFLWWWWSLSRNVFVCK